VPIAEQTGQIRRLTAWVLDRTAAQLARWRADGLELVAAVNLSALDLDAGLARRLGELLSRAGVPPRQLALEITESSVMADAEAAGRALTEVAEMGVRVAIDDFGTGYSSLAQLKRLPVRELKVDRSFVADLVRSPDVRQIVRSTIELGHNLGLEVVAEGVETPEALASLREMSCDKVQGHHVSEPLAAAELAAWLASAAERRGGTVRA
jgi:EAL domain-containing protein (putative c-di-GMP-specific phosphodiesterase class I)